MSTKKTNSSGAVDKSVLEAVIEEVKNTDKAEYTPGSWKRFQSALTRANTAVQNDNATQGEIDRLVIVLNNAYVALSIRGTYLGEIIKNGDINGTTDNWVTHGGTTLGKGYSTRRSAPNSLKVSGGTGTGTGVKQDVTDRVKAGETYGFSVFIYYSNKIEGSENAPDTATFQLSILYGEDETKVDMLPQEIELGKWGEISGTYTIPADKNSADMDQISILIEACEGADVPIFFADDISMLPAFKIELSKLVTEAENMDAAVYTEDL